jgi:folate-dependent phosphoribosylglycinamide formyltransferase PurN
MKWVAFFSQTGSEIVELSKALGRKPDLLVTNNFEEKIRFHPEVKKLDVTIQSARHSLLMDYFRAQKVFDPLSTLITLHGYLRILPEDICNKYGILNGHPGLITLYPELKGKDPQVKAWEGDYRIVGSVVHQVQPEVDEGPIYKSVAYTNRCESLDEMYGLLKKSSLESWMWVLKSYKGLGCELV